MNEKRKKIIMIIFGVMLVALLGIIGYYWYNNTYYVATEDAKISADMVKVSPQISGALLSFNVDEGDTVIKDQIIGRQDMNTLPDTSLNQSLIRASISGVIIKKQANIGEILSPGQTLAVLIDPGKVYVSANIEETNIDKVKVGQLVDISPDQLEGKKITGKVSSIGHAAASAFSLLPSSSSGSFTKVVQKIPVKIALDNAPVNLMPGTNAIVKIHIK